MALQQRPKVLYIHQYFETPEESGRTRSYWFAKELVRRGFEVSVITSMHSHSKRKAGVYDIEGIKVTYLENSYDNAMSIGSKIWSFLRFMFMSSWVCLRMKNVDLVYATSTPLTVGIPALLRKWLRGTPFIFEVRDLWPEFPIQVGAIKNKGVINILRWVEKLIYSNSRHIVALSPGMKDGVISTGVYDGKVSVIPNMSKPDLFYPRECDEQVTRKFGLEKNDFKVIHFGTMGVANGLEYIIHAAHNLHKSKVENIQFYFAGKGAMEEKLIAMVQEFGMNNVHFLGYMNTYEISEIVNCCDVSITSFADLPVLETNSPNKLFDSLAAGKAVIVNSAGWTKTLVEEANCGVYVDVKHPEQLADALLNLSQSLDEVTEMGNNARKLALKKYDKELLVDSFATIVENELSHV